MTNLLFHHLYKFLIILVFNRTFDTSLAIARADERVALSPNYQRNLLRKNMLLYR